MGRKLQCILPSILQVLLTCIDRSESWFWVARYFEMHFSLLVLSEPLLVMVIFIPSQLVEKYFVCFMHWQVFHFSTFFSEKSVKVFTFFFYHVMLEANYHIIRRVFYWFNDLLNCDNRLGNIGWKYYQFRNTIINLETSLFTWKHRYWLERFIINLEIFGRLWCLIRCFQPNWSF